MNQPAEGTHKASDAEHFALGFPYRQSVRIRRDLKHFDLWLQENYKFTIDRPIPLSIIYKDFFLSHIELYPCRTMPGRLISADLQCELSRSGILNAEELSCQKVASIVLSVIRWQHHRFKKINFHILMSDLIQFYRQLHWVTRDPELTYKSTLKSNRALTIFRRHLAKGPRPERDIAMILLSWGYGFSPSELIRLSLDDIEVDKRPLEWRCLRSEVPVVLDHMTAVSIFCLMCESLDLMEFEIPWLINRQDGSTWRALTEIEVEVILERHYRYVGALYGFECYFDPTGYPTPDLLPQEEKKYTKALKRFTNYLYAKPCCTTEDQDNWDDAIRNISSQRPPNETGSIDEQLDWDEIIRDSSHD